MDLGSTSRVRANFRLALAQLAHLDRRLWAPVFVTVFTAILAVQIFLPPAVGMADNGDAERVMGNLGLSPNYPLADRYFAYFTPDYVFGGPMDWRGIPSYTGRMAMHMALLIGRAKPAGHFDVRWLGFVHLAFYIVCFLLLLRALRSAPLLVRYAVPALAIWIFCDVFYAAYLNSFYSDATGFLCYFAMIAALAAVLMEGSPLWAASLFVLAGVLFAFTKPLNGGNAAILGPVIAGFAGWRTAGVRRYAVLLAGVAVGFAGVHVVVNTPAAYAYPALLDAVMVHVAKTSIGPSALQEFGLAPSDSRFAGSNAFDPKGPAYDPGFVARFAKTSSGDLVRWYLRHPAQTFQLLHHDLSVTSAEMRPPLGNFEKQYGLGRSAKSRSFSTWSGGRSYMLRVWPFHVVALYGSSFGILVAAMWRRWRSLLGFGMLLASLAALGIVQFCSASLLDALETPRHLFMFHVTTDVLFLLLASAALWKLAERNRVRPPLRRNPGTRLIMSLGKLQFRSRFQ